MNAFRLSFHAGQGGELCVCFVIVLFIRMSVFVVRSEAPSVSMDMSQQLNQMSTAGMMGNSLHDEDDDYDS